MEPKRPIGAPVMRGSSHSDGLQGMRPTFVDAPLQQEASPAGPDYLDILQYTYVCCCMGCEVPMYGWIDVEAA